jgi:triphosphoribosyl-dephospho-CoA synthase
VRLAEQIELVCLMEATARKPGNVHPGAPFDDLCYDDFVLAAQAIAEPLAAVHEIGLGRAIFNAVEATRTTTGTNVNLGIVLLLAPLAAVPAGEPLTSGVAHVLRRTTVEDAEQVYAAIRLAQPGGMGDAPTQDLRECPTVTLRDAMALAEDRDRIAEQYTTDYRLVLDARRTLVDRMTRCNNWERALISLQLSMMSKWPDTLIARKCGWQVARESALRAAECGVEQIDAFDTWLRADGHRRNPGTTADLIAATLFTALRDDLIQVPSRHEVLQFAATIRERAR